MTEMILLKTLIWLVTKHFICDFPLQAHPYQYLNKGTYGHPGGILHSSIHGIGTLIVLVCCFHFYTDISLSKYFLMTALCVMFDFSSHYHIDWAKVRIGKKYNLKPDNSEWFWILLGFDQFLHMLSYFVIILLVNKVIIHG